MLISDYIGLTLIILAGIIILFNATKYKPFKTTNQMVDDLLPHWQKRKK